jgi:hypothetical protein
MIRAALAYGPPPGIDRPRKTRKGPRSESPLVASLRLQIRAEGLPELTRHALAPLGELVFHPTRKWRFDLAWPDRMLAAEVDGGVWTAGRHTRGAGFVADCEKMNSALLLGWRVLRFPGPHVEDGTAIKFLREALVTLSPSL